MNGAEYVVFGGLLLFSFIDLRIKKIPVIPVLVLGILVTGCRVWSGVPFWEIAAGLVPGSIFLLLAWITKESIGYGDGLVLVVLGLFCGIKETVAVIGMSLIFSALLSMVLLVLKRVGRKTELPFLPCICSGYLISLLW